MSMENYEKKQFSLINHKSPYESVFVDAFIEDGCLIVKDDHFDHGPDGFHSTHITRFDKENTLRLFTYLIKRNPDPIKELCSIASVSNSGAQIKEECDKAGIKYTDSLCF